MLALALGISDDCAVRTDRTTGTGEATGDKAAIAKVEARVSLCKMAREMTATDGGKRPFVE